MVSNEPGVFDEAKVAADRYFDALYRRNLAELTAAHAQEVAKLTASHAANVAGRSALLDAHLAQVIANHERVMDEIDALYGEFAVKVKQDGPRGG